MTTTATVPAPTPAAPTPAYDRLVERSKRAYRLGHLGSIANWDQAVSMPTGGAGARGQALAELAGLLHQWANEPAMADDVAQAATEPLDDVQRADLNETERGLRRARAVPEALVRAQALLQARMEPAWRVQRPANDWAGWLPNFREMVALAREEAQALAAAGVGAGQDGRVASPYDAMIDGYEPGMTAARLDRVFGPIEQALPRLLPRILEAQARQNAADPLPAWQGVFATAKQHAFVESIVGWLGFNRDHGRVDVSTHPFCGGVPEDVRLTVRFDEADPLAALYSAIHECGHGLYEQNLPRDWLGRPIGTARSMGVHESQSLGWEMQVARSPGFVAQLAPRMAEAFGDQPALRADRLLRRITAVEPGFIRVDADEVTYPAHVFLRYRIEHALIEGRMEAGDVPDAWNESMQRLLGIDTRGNYRDGPLQDIHWAVGLVGYFPSYTLGALYAAQWFAAMRRDEPGLDEAIAAGRFDGVRAWLGRAIWSQGRRWDTDELARRATGEALDSRHWLAHIERRYLHSSAA